MDSPSSLKVDEFRKRLRDFGGLMLAVGAAWIGAIGVTTSYSAIFSTQVDYVASVIVIALGGVLSILGWFLPARKGKWRGNSVRLMKEEDIDELYLLQKSYGPTSNLANKVAILHKNKKCFFVVERQDGRSKLIFGYFVAYRLNAPAVGRAAIAKVAEGFMTAFPDMIVSMDSLVIQPDVTAFHWTLTGTNTGQGGTGNKVKISGVELWQFDADGLIRDSKGSFDAEEYNRQLGVKK